MTSTRRTGVGPSRAVFVLLPLPVLLPAVLLTVLLPVMPDRVAGSAPASPPAPTARSGPKPLPPAPPPPPPAPPRRTALSPAESAKLFRLSEPGLDITLVAAEPQIEAPVAAAFDEDGTLWVVEMRDYPDGPGKGKTPLGRIKRLEDRDGDGRFESATVFAEGLNFANGLLPWRGGLIVTAAPHILYLRDTDGDGRAEEPVKLWTGFTEGNPQLRVSHPVLEADGWVTVANGLRGGSIRRADRPEDKPVVLGPRDFRFDPATGAGATCSGPGQFGNTVDAWGRRFVCDNRHHLRYVALPEHALRRNPLLAVPAVVQDTGEDADGPAASGARVHPLTRQWTTSTLHAGRFTAACGVTAFDGDAWPEGLRGLLMTCEPTGNLVHADRITPEGAGFRSRPLREGVELLASTDEWFRPVSLLHAPDGSLLVVDMHRAVVEHPEWMPAELKKRGDLLWGAECGRIWRVAPAGTSRRPAPRLSTASSAGLAALLGHPNQWHRTTAQRLLADRSDALQPLLAAASAAKEPLARRHALWLLDRRGELSDAMLIAALKDGHAGVREAALQIAEARLSGKPGEVPARTSAGVSGAAAGLADDPDPRVRFAVAVALGAVEPADPAVTSGAVPGEAEARSAEGDVLNALTRVAVRAGDDPWTAAVVAAAARGPRTAEVLQRILGGMARAHPHADTRAVRRLLGQMVGAGGDAAGLAAILAGSQATDEVLTETLHAVAEGCRRRGTRLGELSARLPAGLPRERFDKLLSAAAGQARDGRLPETVRVPAVAMLAHAPTGEAMPALTALLAAGEPTAVRVAAVQALGSRAEADIPALLLAGWRAMPQPLRTAVLEALSDRPERRDALMAAVEAGSIQAGEIDGSTARRLRDDRRPEARARAEKLFREATPAERRAAIEKFQSALTLAGDTRRGREVFVKNCGVCHRIGDAGTGGVGPDIGDTRTKTPAMLLNDVLNPNAAIDAGYFAWQLRTRDDRVLTGLLTADTGSAVVLRTAEGRTETVLRADVDELRNTGKSLMPEGLERTMTVEQMADLLAWLKNWRYLDGSVPGAPK